MVYNNLAWSLFTDFTEYTHIQVALAERMQPTLRIKGLLGWPVCIGDMGQECYMYHWNNERLHFYYRQWDKG